MEIPRVSIVMPTYNRLELLKRSVKSISEQTLGDWELIVINDASTDGTKEWLNELAKKDARVRPGHNETNNYPDISKILDHGLSLAHAPYVARLDDDDYWCDPQKLEKQVRFLDAHKDCVVVGGGTIVIDDHDNERFRYRKPESDRAIRAKALLANPFTHSTVMFRRDSALAAGGYGNFKNAEDWDLWLRMGIKGTFYNMPDFFVRYMMIENSKTVIFKRSQSREILRLISAHRREYPNFATGFSVNFAQYLYSLLPAAVRRPFYNFLSRLKRTVASPK